MLVLGTHTLRTPRTRTVPLLLAAVVWWVSGGACSTACVVCVCGAGISQAACSGRSAVRRESRAFRCNASCVASPAETGKATHVYRHEHWLKHGHLNSSHTPANLVRRYTHNPAILTKQQTKHEDEHQSHCRRPPRPEFSHIQIHTHAKKPPHNKPASYTHAMRESKVEQGGAAPTPRTTAAT
jgi:hypothetical protein